MQIDICSSHGKYGNVAFVIDENGNVLETHLEPSWEGPIPVKFDTAEYAHCYGKLDGSIDILDIGYTLLDGSYEPAEADFRDEVRFNAECQTALTS